MPYAVKLSKRAERQLSRVPEAAFQRLVHVLRTLELEPRPRGSRKMAGKYPSWRLRVGEYRVKYTILDDDRLISVDSVERRTTTTYRRR